MIRRYFFIGLLAMGLSACQTSTRPEIDEVTMLVGTYTDKGSEGIYTFRFNQNTGEATPLATFRVTNPSHITLSADGEKVYAVTETADSSAVLNAYRFDKQTGELIFLNSEFTFGEDPCYVATNGTLAVTANYTGGSMTVFPLGGDGSLLPADTLFCGAIGGPDFSRQDMPHIHCAYFSPDGEHLFATDFSADRILKFDVHTGSTRPQPAHHTTILNPDYGPRHIEFAPDGKHAYVIGELSDDITVMDYEEGNLYPKQVVNGSDAGGRGGADIHISPDGKFLYASHRLTNDGISIFAIDADEGTLTKVGYQPTGLHPRNFSITPNGKYLLCACRDSNVIQVFKIHPTGLLTDTGKDIPVSQAVCVKFTE